MRELIIDENYFATPKTMVLGNSGEVASRKIKVTQPEVNGATCYIARFSVQNGNVFETEITDGIITVPAVVLYEMGEGYMQWVARDTAGQLIAKSDLISYSVLRSLSDETTPVPVVEDTESAVSQIKEAYETAVHGLEQLNGYGTIAEVVQARRSAISNEICSSLTERIDYDITQLQSAIESGTIIDDLEISGGIINSNSDNSIYLDGGRFGLIAMGKKNTASGDLSIAIGYGNTASGSKSAAIGQNNNADGPYAFAVGLNNKTSGNRPVAIGGNNTAYQGSVAIGNGNTANNSSVSIGASNTASKTYSMSLGCNNKISSAYSYALGKENTIEPYAYHSVAIGDLNSINGEYAFTIGHYLTTNVDGQTVIGRYNDYSSDSTGNSVFVIGNGTDTSNRSNAMTVDWNGNLNVSGNVTATMTDGSTISLIDIYSKIGLIEEQLASLVTSEGTA